MLAFLGMGLLGSNFVRAALERGEKVRIWNRSRDKAQALAPLGAVVCDDPAQAVQGATRVHLTLSDDAAVDEVLERAAPGLAADALIVDHTTTSPHGTAARVAKYNASSTRFFHAPVFMGPQNARDATGLMLASGDAALVERLRPELERMTGKLWYVGAEPERAASFKLLGNLFLMFITSGLRDTFALAQAVGIGPEEAATLFQHFNPGKTLEPRIERMLRGEFHKPSWELSMARKDARLMLEAAERGKQPLSVVPAIASLMDEYIGRGHGHDDWTVVAKDVLDAARGKKS